jgi:uncharacterized membrane protein
MNESRLMKQVGAIFGAFMTIFYVGIGLYLFLPNIYWIDKFLRILVGSTFILYGIYRAFRTYQKIIEAFFSEDKDEE